MIRRPVTDERQRGFTLIEVLIALLVVSVGLLGLAKIQAAAVSSTQITGERSLVALQASSLAAAMHGNRTFWASGAAPASFSMSGTNVTDSSGVLSATVGTCVAGVAPASPACTPAQLAAYDVQGWASNMNQQFPTYSASATCTTLTTAPISCTLTVSWLEKYVSGGQTSAADSTATSGARSYTLYVEP